MKSITIIVLQLTGEFEIIKDDPDFTRSGWDRYVYAGSSELEVAQFAYTIESRADIKAEIAKLVTDKTPAFKVGDIVATNFADQTPVTGVRLGASGEFEYAVVTSTSTTLSVHWRRADELNSRSLK